MDEKIVHRFDVLGEKSHGRSPGCEGIAIPFISVNSLRFAKFPDSPPSGNVPAARRNKRFVPCSNRDSLSLRPLVVEQSFRA
jgi:hypothetical protein